VTGTIVDKAEWLDDSGQDRSAFDRVGAADLTPPLSLVRLDFGCVIAAIHEAAKSIVASLARV
jgi:hypothetical protein